MQSAAARLWPKLSDELRDATGIDNGFFRCGGITIVESSHDADLQSQLDQWRQTGIEHEVLDAAALRKCEPHVSAGPGTLICRVPGVAQVRNPRHIKALVSGCRLRGVELRTGEPVLGFRRSERGISAVHTPTGELSAGQFVLASGAWSNSLLAGCGYTAQIVPVRGQIVLLSADPLPFRHIIECGPRYLVPRPDGRILIGSTEEWVSFNKGNTSSGVQGLLEFAENLVPTLAAARFEQCWSGLRPHTARGMPYVGRLPEHDNLLVAAGHFRGGLSLSPITAKLIGQLLTDETPDLPLGDLGLSP